MTPLQDVPHASLERGRDLAGSWRTALLFSALNCLAFCDRMMLAFLAPAIKTALGVSDTMLGALVGTAFALPNVLGLVLFASIGAAADRLWAVRLSLVAGTTASVLCGLAPSGGALLAARMALGFSQAPLTPAAATHLAGLFPADRLGRATSVFTSGATLGRSIAFLGGGVVLAWIGLPWLGTQDGWRAVFVLTLLPSAILLALLLRMRERPTAPTTQGREPVLWAWMWSQRRALATHTLSAAMAALVLQSVAAWTTTVLVNAHHLPLAQAGSLYGTIFLVCAPLGHLGGGALLDMLHRRGSVRPHRILIAACMSAGCLAVILFGLAARLDHAILGLGCATFLLSVGVPAWLTGIQTLAPPRLRTRVTSLFMACVVLIALGFGPPVVGALSDHGLGSARIGEALSWVVGAATLISLLALAAQPNKRVAP
jgi:MFS family permease